MNLFIFGIGYSALAIARLAQRKGFRVSGTTRSSEKLKELEKQGITAFIFSKNQTEQIENIRKALDLATHILSSIPPQENGDIVLPIISGINDEINREAENKTKKLYYLSTTGVYGDYSGNFVDESSETRPNSERLKRRVIAEKAWLEQKAQVFRLAGIYGPNRSVLDDIKSGTARRIYKKDQVFSRIHVDDIAEILVAAMLAPSFANTSFANISNNIYNVCDDEAAPAYEVVDYACRIMNINPPSLIPYEQADLSPMAREFYSANRRVKNDKIKNELGINLRYPTYREGLAQCLQKMLKE